MRFVIRGSVIVLSLAISGVASVNATEPTLAATTTPQPASTQTPSPTEPPASQAPTIALTPPPPTFEKWIAVPVLMYHRIVCTRPDGTYSSQFVCPDRLEAQMARLEADGWTSVTANVLAEALEARACLPPKTFVITVDDGALDGYENGAPIWEAHGFRASFYMPVGKAGDYLGQPNGGADMAKPHFSFDQARDLVARGHLIGSHTWSHSPIASAGPAKLDREVRQAQDRLNAEGLAHAPLTFVYPYGSNRQSAVDYLEGQGYSMAFTTLGGGVHESIDPLRSPRIRVGRSTTPGDLASRMSNFANPCG